MVIPVSATSYKQKKISSYNIYNSIYYGKYSHDYKFGSDYLDTYDVDINNDGYPEHISLKMQHIKVVVNLEILQ